MRDIAQETGGTFGVALDDGHLEELIREGVRPREIIKKEKTEPKTKAVGQEGAESDEDEDDDDDDDGGGGGAELMQMGFPLRLPTHAPPALCACHSRLYPATSGDLGGSKKSSAETGSSGFLCPRCGVKICDVPTDCPVCGLTVVMSTHLARSYRHLFPIRRWLAVTWEDLAARPEAAQSCRGCDERFPPLPAEYIRQGVATNGKSANKGGDGDVAMGSASDRTPVETNASTTTAQSQANGSSGNTATLAPSSRYECPKCHEHFCLECDSYVHEELFVCPGCG